MAYGLNFGDGGLYLPPLTTAQRMGFTPAQEGLIVYDTDLDQAYVYATGAWREVDVDNEGPGAVDLLSADAGNTAVLGTDSLVFVPTPPPGGVSTDADNNLTIGTDGKLYVDVSALETDTSFSLVGSTLRYVAEDGLNDDVTLASLLSTDADNAAVAGTDGKVFVPEVEPHVYSALVMQMTSNSSSVPSETVIHQSSNWVTEFTYGTDITNATAGQPRVTIQPGTYRLIGHVFSGSGQVYSHWYDSTNSAYVGCPGKNSDSGDTGLPIAFVTVTAATTYELRNSGTGSEAFKGSALTDIRDECTIIRVERMA